MFGRTGQMFPRRAYHDAMYEEEYGSESSDHCCRGRGVTSILCWCFSVILLIGLAASVILTVFFVLKSRNLMGVSSSGGSGGGSSIFDDLDLFYGNSNNDEKSNKMNHNNEKDISSTTEVNLSGFDFTSIERNLNDEVILMTKNTISTTMPSSIIPSSTRNILYQPTGHIYEVTTSRSSTMVPVTTRPNTKISPTQMIVVKTTPNSTKRITTPLLDTYEKENGNFLQKERELTRGLLERPPSEGINNGHDFSKHNSESDEHYYSVPSSNPRTSSSEENLSSTTHAHVLFSMPPSHSHGISVQRKRPNRGPPPTSFTTSTDRQEPIPPIDTDPVLQLPFPTSTTPTTPTNPIRQDLLAKIIKNLAPKFKNKTQIFSSNERKVPRNPNTRIKTMIRTRTTSTSPPPIEILSEESSQEVLSDEVVANDIPILPNQNTSMESNTENVIQLVQPPKFEFNTPKPKNYSSIDSQDQDFIDILVGDENQKRLITKETEEGIITSAILPSWFVNDTEYESQSNSSIFSHDLFDNNSNSSMMMTTTTIDDKDINPMDSIGSGSSQSFTNHNPNGFGQMFINVVNSGSDFSLPPPITIDHQVHLEPKRPTSFKDLLKELSPMFPSTSSTPPSVDDDPTNGLRYGEIQHNYGYNQEDFGQTFEQDKFREDELNSSEIEDEKIKSTNVDQPTHIIDISYDPKKQPEIIIESSGQTQPEYNGDHRIIHYHREPLSSGSELHSHTILPPIEFTNDSSSSINLTQQESPTITAQPPNFSAMTFPPISIPSGASKEFKDTRINNNNNIIRTQHQKILSLPSMHVPMNTGSSGFKSPINNVPEFKPTKIEEDYDGEGDRMGEEVDEYAGTVGDETVGANEEVSLEDEDSSNNKFDRVPINAIQSVLPKDENLDENDYFTRRQPVSQLDESLYQLQNPGQIVIPTTEAELGNLGEVQPTRFPNGFDDKVTTKPINKVHEVYPIKYHTMTQAPTTVAPSLETEPIRNHSGFVPPEPMDFHSNVYNFRPSISSNNGFTPMVSDNWRPVVYKEEEQYNQQNHPQHMNHNPNIFQPTGLSDRPNSSPLFQNPTSSGSFSNNGGSILPSFAEAIKLRPTTTGSQFDKSVESNVRWSNPFSTIKSTKAPPIFPSQPIPPNRVKFPKMEQEATSLQANVIIDRSKYMHRPAPPPILMRRHPQPPVRPNRRKTFRDPPYLSQEQQIQQQRMLKQRLFQQQVARLRERGNVHWPNEQPIRRVG